jgi:hypothetical protein
MTETPILIVFVNGYMFGYFVTGSLTASIHQHFEYFVALYGNKCTPSVPEACSLSH